MSVNFTNAEKESETVATVQRETQEKGQNVSNYGADLSGR